MLEARTTIAVVIRESHSITPAMLESLFAHTPTPRRVVVVLGGEPPRVRRVVERLALEYDFTFVHGDAVITANEARNLALTHVSTPYVCFVDNDTFVPEHWLQKLEQCADETGASVVACPVLWGSGDHWDIHYAGGTCRIVEEDGVRRFEEHNPLMHQPVSALATMVRSPTEYVEPHLFLVRTAAVRDEGIFDEGLVAAREHSMLSLRIRDAGGSMWLEPQVVVRYPWPKHNTLSDYTWYLPRWSSQWAARSFRRFNELWNLNDTAIDDFYQWGHLERRVGRPPRGKTLRARTKRAGYRVRRAVDLVVTPVLVRRCDRRRARAGPAEVLHTASWDRTGAPEPVRASPSG